MTKYYLEDTDLISVADAIRAKGETTDPLVFPAGFVSAIDDIPTGTDLIKEIYKFDGKCRLVVEVEEDELDFWFQGGTGYNRNLTIDWGDGTTETTPTGTDFSGEFRHTYLKAGQYLITISETTHSTGATRDLFFPSLSWGTEHGSYMNGYISIKAIGLGDKFGYSQSNCVIKERCDFTDIFIGITSDATGVTLGNTNLFYKSASLRRAIVKVANSNSVAIPASMFSNCVSLRKIELPDAITSIGNSAFYGCYSLEQIDLPSGITSFGDYCFRWCGFREITFPSSLTTLGASAFMQCKKLTEVIIRRTDALVSLGSNVFDSTPIASGTGYIYVPDALVEDYKAATNWSTYAAQIKGLSELPTA